MRHPLEWIPGQIRKPLFWIFLGLTLVLLFLFQPANRPLMTGAAPSGIISLQLAWTPDNALAMLDSWDGTARLFAAFGLGFDYLFMPVYALALALGTLLAAGRHPGGFARLGSWVAYAAFLAAIFDGLENLGQFQELFHGRVDLALVIGFFATVKFTLILIGLAYGLVGWFWKKSR
jgi:hypothetical protein